MGRRLINNIKKMNLLFRLRNLTKSIYEYLMQSDTLPVPTELPDNPADTIDNEATAIISKEETI